MMYLSLLIASGLLGGLGVMALGSRINCRHIASGTVLISLWVFYGLTQQMVFSDGGIQLMESLPWIPYFNVRYMLGIDGLSWALVGLTLLINCIVIAGSYLVNYTRMRLYLALFLLMQSMVIGVFLAYDAILFYMFWEGMLIPMYLCIGVWGSSQRSYAAMKFFLYTFLGSVLMLVGFIYLGIQAQSFSFLQMASVPLSLFEQQWLFLALLAAFAVKIPMFPFHTWLPDAHTEAPASGSVILAALMLKVGAYGLIRVSMPILPDASAYFAPLMIGLSLIAIVYVGIVAFSQQDMKRLIAYSSVAHMGFVTLGLFLIYRAGDADMASLGMTGAVVQMISHAFGSGALFCAFGLLYHQCHERSIIKFSGLGTKMPWFSMFFLLFVLSTIGLPLTAGFVGEYLVIMTALQTMPLVGLCAAITLVLSAAYLLTMYKQAFFGMPSDIVEKVRDIHRGEVTLLLFISLVVLALGIYPQGLIQVLYPPITQLLDAAVSSKLLV